MSYKVVMRVVEALLLGPILLGVLGLIAPQAFQPDVVKVSPAETVRYSAAATPAETFDSALAADISAMRWQAMAEFYAKHDMLTREDFAEVEAPTEPAAPAGPVIGQVSYESTLKRGPGFRWQALAEILDSHGLPTRPTVPPDEATAYRWLAMARFYEQHGMLTREPFDYEQAAEDLAFRWRAMAEWYERMGLLNER